MKYFFHQTVNGDFEEISNRTRDLLKTHGFGVLTEINLDQAFKEKLGVDFKRYRILGACNPNFAYQALQQEDKLGVFLPCNVLVIEQGPQEVEIVAVDPVAAMSAVHNPQIGPMATEVQAILQQMVSELGNGTPQSSPQ
ncbi:DUF302 domain-containing protein [Pontibacter sp. G13]|uniref:DUF302 domain-containing protein n=1 Tax=Pontibacter sp. G13 TaxID=3074898 RepID=UPI00288B2A6F|nr:DUF302 domain-containing protein [Pontibacter sp. G13]WNJ17326.1 DUF302 domain-containing protein [Pontibacter sp. G13]